MDTQIIDILQLAGAIYGVPLYVQILTHYWWTLVIDVVYATLFHFEWYYNVTDCMDFIS